MDRERTISRRRLMAAGAATAVAASLGVRPANAGATSGYRLSAAAARVPLVGAGYPGTDVWAYDGAVPGPEIRVRQGERLRVVVENRLPEETTVHWHGVRVPNAMDGVPHLTQPPIAPGESFVYEFDAAGCRHLLVSPAPAQLRAGRRAASTAPRRRGARAARPSTATGLGARRLAAAARRRVGGDFGNRMDIGMAGRIGNTVTVNGRVPTASPCAAASGCACGWSTRPTPASSRLDVRGPSAGGRSRSTASRSSRTSRRAAVSCWARRMRADLVLDMRRRARSTRHRSSTASTRASRTGCWSSPTTLSRCADAATGCGHGAAAQPMPEPDSRRRSAMRSPRRRHDERDDGGIGGKRSGMVAA